MHRPYHKWLPSQHVSLKSARSSISPQTAEQEKVAKVSLQIVGQSRCKSATTDILIFSIKFSTVVQQRATHHHIIATLSGSTKGIAPQNKRMPKKTSPSLT